MKKSMNKTTRSNFITYGIVIVLFAALYSFLHRKSFQTSDRLLVPLCVYTIAAISLNLVVGVSVS